MPLEYNDTLLHMAAQYGRINIIDSLLNAGAEINAQMTQGSTSIYVAVSYGHRAAALHLASRGADPFIPNTRVDDVLTNTNTNTNFWSSHSSPFLRCIYHANTTSAGNAANALHPPSPPPPPQLPTPQSKISALGLAMALWSHEVSEQIEVREIIGFPFPQTLSSCELHVTLNIWHQFHIYFALRLYSEHSRIPSVSRSEQQRSPSWLTHYERLSGCTPRQQNEEEREVQVTNCAITVSRHRCCVVEHLPQGTRANPTLLETSLPH